MEIDLKKFEEARRDTIYLFESIKRHGRTLIINLLFFIIMFVFTAIASLYDPIFYVILGMFGVLIIVTVYFLSKNKDSLHEVCLLIKFIDSSIDLQKDINQIKAHTKVLESKIMVHKAEKSMKKPVAKKKPKAKKKAKQKPGPKPKAKKRGRPPKKRGPGRPKGSKTRVKSFKW